MYKVIIDVDIESQVARWRWWLDYIWLDVCRKGRGVDYSVLRPSKIRVHATCFCAIYLKPNSRLKARPMTIFLTSVVPAPIS